MQPSTVLLLVFGALLVAGLKLLVWMAKRDHEQFEEAKRNYDDSVMFPPSHHP